LPLDVPIQFAGNVVHVSAAEVFGAEEAADLFLSYHRSADIPDRYVLRPVEGYRSDGSRVDLDDADG
jgi:hypothetical protein